MLNKLLTRRPKPGASPCAPETAGSDQSLGRIALVGSPNVGKSVMFAHLSGLYVTVSNYPGTTVEVSRGVGEIGGRRYEVVDTPGMYSLLPLSEEERVARSILLEQRPEVVLHLVDAKSLERMLSLTFQLIEAGLPVVLVLNMMDEAEAKGLSIDAAELERLLGIPVVPTVCTQGRGLAELRDRIGSRAPGPVVEPFRYRERVGLAIEEVVGRIERLLGGDYGVSRRCLALLLLQDDREVHALVSAREPDTYEQVRAEVEAAREGAGRPIDYLLALERRRWAVEAASAAVSQDREAGPAFRERLSRLLVHPLSGVPVLLLVLYFGLYKLVGEFGAGTVVDFLESRVFETWLNPLVTAATQWLIPWPVIQDLFVGEYGVLTLGLRYAVAIILPIVSLFFLVFSFIEDVGYLPRLALLVDRLFKKIGLSGRAVIPMVLGFGCGAMATMVTRTLSTKRERV
ncbi:MAG: FeoB small GTPase domain-containing protein, partial [Planctomycetota bacterium]